MHVLLIRLDILVSYTKLFLVQLTRINVQPENVEVKLARTFSQHVSGNLKPKTNAHFFARLEIQENKWKRLRKVRFGKTCV